MHFTAFDKAAGLPVVVSSRAFSRLPETVLLCSLIAAWLAMAVLAVALYLMRTCA